MSLEAIHRFRHVAMATQFEVRCAHPDGEYARHAARAAFEVVDRLEQQLSRFVENSDVSRINHLAPGESTVVGYETMHCLLLASLVYNETRGAFDVAVGTGFDHLELIPGEFRVRAGRGGIGLDMGAIGKGYSVDRIADVLEDWGVTRALIDAGYSSVLALDPPSEGSDWPLTLSTPGDPGAVFARIGARQRSLGASGIRKGDHILDPRSREPVRRRQAAWLSAPRDLLAAMSRLEGAEDSPSALADAFSTAFIVGRREEVEEYCRAHPGLEAWILDEGLFHVGGECSARPCDRGTVSSV